MLDRIFTFLFMWTLTSSDENGLLERFRVAFKAAADPEL